ncbi:MAG TPA: DNA mismatch repair endonuclease MutL [Thermoanaerobaculia bacterium]|nr:DNA mismatch repair endonuclease MutL [Thermoanaerobaculia bacterium]
MARIHLLPDPLVSQIAAGEVVERPASVVKELVENALDAGAGEVRVELEAGGKRRIVVTDDGCGMGRDDALLAFDRHATSKIASFDDLEQVTTLGFRGEALSSIAAVARVELVTAERPGDGHRVAIEAGRVRVAEPTAHPRGTRVSVASLLFSVPARRKFLKTPATELRRALEVVQGYALARPDVRFVVVHEGRTLLDALPAGAPGADPESARRRVGQIFGDAFAAELVPLPAHGPSGSERVWGLVGKPSTARGRRQFVFVDRRLLRDRAVLATFYRAVRDTWRSDDFPALFLFVDLPPGEVDVNVHPQKAEVRFRDPRLVDRLGERLRQGLDAARGEEPAALAAPHGPPSAPFVWQGLGDRSGDGPPGAAGGWQTGEPRPVYGTTEATWSAGGSGSPLDAGRLATTSYTPLERAPVPLSGRSGEVRPFRLLGQYKATLLLLEGPDGLYLIDQHVAHERILYERLRRSLAGQRTPSQGLLEPRLLDLAPAEALRLEAIAEELESHGFSVAPLSGHQVALTAFPAMLDTGQAEAMLRQLAGGEATGGDGEGEAESLARRLLDALAASLACKAAVKMHHPLAAAEMEALVTELFAAENPYACPHGRPIVLTMSDADLERRFGRR